jgi:hypothetical protein
MSPTGFARPRLFENSGEVLVSGVALEATLQCMICRHRQENCTQLNAVAARCCVSHRQLIDHGHVECIERPPASASGLHTLRSLYH